MSLRGSAPKSLRGGRRPGEREARVIDTSARCQKFYFFSTKKIGYMKIKWFIYMPNDIASLNIFLLPV